MKTSYHNHTPRCHHAFGTEEEFAAAAYAAGYEKFGFSDHTPYPFREGYVSSVRMSIGEMEGYVRSLLSLRERYKGKMEIYIGFETEYYPQYFDRLLDEYRKYPIDYLLLGQHGFGAAEGDEGWINSFSETDSAEKLLLYTDTVIEAIRTGRFSCVAHPDVFHFVGDADLYREQARRLIRTANACGVLLEVNMYGTKNERHYPNPLFWDEAGALGAKVILGRDAHSVDRVEPVEEYLSAMQFVEKHKLDLQDDMRLIRPLF